jgi:hypothetical protein
MNIKTKQILIAIAFTTFSMVTQAAKAEKEWTFLLFLNGHNSLSSFGAKNLIDMEKSGSTDNVNMVVEWGSEDTKITERLLVQKSADPTKVTSPVVMSLPNRDMGDYKNFVEFVKWGVDNYPAKHYFVAIWNHGAGWHFQDMNVAGGTVHISDISYDDDSSHHISTEQLGLAMGEIKTYLGRNVDIYGSDACLMQMMEVAGEMKNSVNYLVGSEETEPGEGWPYEPFMNKWTATPTMAPADVAMLLSKEYTKAYNGGVYSRQEVTFSALDLSKYDALVESTKVLTAHLKSMTAASLKKITTAMTKVQKFYYPDYKDLGNFLKTVSALPFQKDAKLFSQVQSDLKSLVMTVDSTTSFATAQGVSIWIPDYKTTYMDRYKGLAFDKSTGWSSFLELIVPK